MSRGERKVEYVCVNKCCLLCDHLEWYSGDGTPYPKCELHGFSFTNDGIYKFFCNYFKLDERLTTKTEDEDLTVP
mgnify:CR=1 FL=1